MYVISVQRNFRPPRVLHEAYRKLLSNSIVGINAPVISLQSLHSSDNILKEPLGENKLIYGSNLKNHQTTQLSGQFGLAFDLA